MPVDYLDSVLRRFSISASQIHSGPLCGTTDGKFAGDAGHLHVIRCGLVELQHEPYPPLHIVEPTVVLYPRALPHRFHVDAQYTAEFDCATIAFSAGRNNPFVLALPPVLAVRVSELPEMQVTLDLLFAQSRGAGSGHQAMADRLFEVLLIQILRKVVDDGVVSIGMLAGLGHPQIGKALIGMHADLARRWTLHELASLAGVSRSHFASAFKATLGVTMVNYLSGCRIASAQAMLRNGVSLKRVASDVGFSSPVAMARVFRERLGESPRDWLRADRIIQSTSAGGSGIIATVANVAAAELLQLQIAQRTIDLQDANEQLLIAALTAQEQLESILAQRREIELHGAKFLELLTSLGGEKDASIVAGTASI